MKKLLPKAHSYIQDILLNNKLFSKTVYEGLLLFQQKNNENSKNYYIDVSNFSSLDNQTGIQRVVREVIFQMLSTEGMRDNIHFVMATKKIGYRKIDFETSDNQVHFFRDKVGKATPLVALGKNDVFLGLDFAPNIIPHHVLAFIKWRLTGAKLIWVLYDILPLQHPEWFTEVTQDTYKPWLTTLFMVSTDILCISETVRQQVRNYAYDMGLTPKVSHIHLGYSFHSNISRNAIESVTEQFKTAIGQKKYSLMVGTLEPRKGHLDVVTAFSKLWQDKKIDNELVLAGKAGWNIEALKDLIVHHPLYNKKLFWLEQVNDNDLLWLYEHCSGVVVASHGEGYGLPLIEAISHNKPTLVRNLEVFEEVADGKNNITFFDTKQKPLDKSIQDWITHEWSQPILPNKFEEHGLGWATAVEDIIYSAQL